MSSRTTKAPSIITLRVYDIGYNQIGGSAPASADMPDLEVFVISHNRFEGQLISGGEFNAFGLRVVKLDGNELLGVIAPMFLILQKLEVVNITGNLFSGELPDELRFCQKMTYVGLGHCQFSGVIPTQLGLMASLQEMDISGNVGVHGGIPEELSALTSLTRFDVSETGVTGAFPEPFCEQVQQENLEILANCSLVECCSP